MVGNLDLTIIQGSTFRRTLSLFDNDNQPLDLSDVDNVQMQIRQTITSTDVLLDVGGDGYIFVEGNPLDGKISIDIPPLATSSINSRKGVYDIELHYINGDVYRILEGKVTVSLEVTR